MAAAAPIGETITKEDQKAFWAEKWAKKQAEESAGNVRADLASKSTAASHTVETASRTLPSATAKINAIETTGSTKTDKSAELFPLFEIIPVEHLLNIFEHQTLREIAKNSLTCKLWHDAIDEYILKVVNINFERYDVKNILSLENLAITQEYLQTLEKIGHQFTSHIGCKAVFEYCSNIKLSQDLKNFLAGDLIKNSTSLTPNEIENYFKFRPWFDYKRDHALLERYLKNVGGSFSLEEAMDRIAKLTPNQKYFISKLSKEYVNLKYCDFTKYDKKWFDKTAADRILDEIDDYINWHLKQRKAYLHKEFFYNAMQELRPKEFADKIEFARSKMEETQQISATVFSKM